MTDKTIFVLFLSLALCGRFSWAATPDSSCNCHYNVAWQTGVTNTTEITASCSWILPQSKYCNQDDHIRHSTCDCGYGATVSCTQGQSSTTQVFVNNSYSNFEIVDMCSYYEVFRRDAVIDRCVGCYDCVLTVTRNGIVDTIGNPNVSPGEYDCTVITSKFLCVHGEEDHVNSGSVCDCHGDVTSEGPCVPSCSGLVEQNLTVAFDSVNNGSVCVLSQESMCPVDPGDCNDVECPVCEVCEECGTCPPCSTQAPCTESACPTCPSSESGCVNDASYLFVLAALGGVVFGGGVVFLVA